jgi:hypothetical protein
MPGGRPAFQPTEEQRKNVEVLAGLGIPEEDICRIVRDRNDKPISKNTLRNILRKSSKPRLPTCIPGLVTL